MPLHHLPATSYAGQTPKQDLPRTATATHRGSIVLPDGRIVEAVIKAFPPEGDASTRDLINEFIGHWLAERWGFPTPPNAGTVQLTRAACPDLPFWRLMRGRRQVTAWWTERVATTSINQRLNIAELARRGALHSGTIDALMDELAKAPAIADTIAFDDLTANVDRNPGNLLGPVGERYLLIDHGRLLTGHRWCSTDFTDPAKAHPNWLRDNLDLRGRYWTPTRHRAALKIEALCDSAPSVLPALDAELQDLLEDADRTAVVAFLTHRCLAKMPAKLRVGAML